jgi:hypothetical protein
MVDFLIGALIIGGYILVAVLIARLARRLLAGSRSLGGSLALAGIYAGLFGVGIAGGGGDPGFAFPAPVSVAAGIGVVSWIPWKPFLRGVIIPFVFWWILILAFIMISDWIKRRRSDHPRVA